VASKTRVDHNLLFVVGFLELEKEDAGGEIVNIGYPQRREFGVELVRDDLRS
jgi:hypothetical protein